MPSIRELKDSYITPKSYLSPTRLFHGICSYMRSFLFRVLSVGPMPTHVAFIPDGNRRYGKKHNLEEEEGHRVGFLNLMTVLRYCYEMGIHCVSLYGFSIDNFKRNPSEVRNLMTLIQLSLDSIISDTTTCHHYGIRFVFVGNLDLLEESVREATRKAMLATEGNARLVLLVCLAYTSTDDILHGMHGVVGEFAGRNGEVDGVITTVTAEDIDRHMYYSGVPDPDVLIRTSGETRLSNFLLWQTSTTLLYAVRCLWPEISLRHLVCAVLDYQRKFDYLEKIKKKV